MSGLILTPDDGVAIVTGAGSGLGRALAVKLCERGFRVVGTGRRSAALGETRTMAGHLFQPLPLDVGNAAAVRDAFAGLGPLALLINNAAVYPRRDFLDESGESFMDTVAVNLGGVAACSRAALAQMCTTGRGRIVNVASFADIAPLPAASAYSVSKGAARILTRAMVADLGDRFPGIVIGDWLPGMLRTGMGIPDGTAPETAAAWGVALALDMDPGLNGTVFERDTELLPAKGIKRKLRDLVLLRRRHPRRLTGGTDQ